MRPLGKRLCSVLYANSYLGTVIRYGWIRVI